MDATALKKTALHDWHVAHGATMVDFAGWSMPVHYGSIVDEHVSTRTAAALFDVSHMGRLRFSGERAAEFLDGIVTRKVANLSDGQVKYGLITNETGGILDDVLVYRLPEHDGGFTVSMVVNAGNRSKICNWLMSQSPDDFGVQISDVTETTCMIALQGPAAIQIADAVLDEEVAALKYYRGMPCRVDSLPASCSRTGYTGEDGCELIVPAEHATEIWQRLFEAGAGVGIAAAGLGARDTLRLEAAMPLYGHELTEQINPYQAGLGFAVNLKDREFVGRQALVAARKDTKQSVRVGLKLAGKRAAREGYPLFAEDREVGTITSGTLSPTLGYPISMGYVAAEFQENGTSLEVDVRGKRLPIEVVPLPFYKRPE